MARRRKALLLLVAALVAAAGCGGAGGGEGNLTPREQGVKSTYEGSYQVKGWDSDGVKGVGIYSDGSFRIMVEGTPRIVIHNQQSGENWLIDMALKTYTPITYDDALARAGFMPGVVMKGYFELYDYWTGSEFRMDTPDGRSVKAYLDGPGHLPTRWLAESKGKLLMEISWEYSRVGRVSPQNFSLPEGLTPSG
jgi:hypothetical protein